MRQHIAVVAAFWTLVLVALGFVAVVAYDVTQALIGPVPK